MWCGYTSHHLEGWALAASTPKETGGEDMVLIQLAHNRVHVFVNMILNSGFYKRQRIC